MTVVIHAYRNKEVEKRFVVRELEELAERVKKQLFYFRIPILLL